MEKQEQYNTFLKEFKRLKNNPIYFIDKYYNVINANNPLELTDDEKQSLFNRYKAIPFFEDFGRVHEYEKRIEELKKQGYKDWEIF